MVDYVRVGSRREFILGELTMFNSRLFEVESRLGMALASGDKVIAL